MPKYSRRKIIALSAVLSALIILAVIYVAKTIFAPSASVEETIRVFDPLRGKFSEILIVTHDGEPMVPFKKILESFGSVVTWNEQTETVRASNPKNDFTLSVKIGDDKAVINGLETAISTPPQIIDDIPYVPFDLIRQIPGVVISEDVNENLQIWAADVFIKYHGWTQLSDGLVAHAGGGLYKDEDELIPQIYTNSREAMEKSYANGHRVFEMDFLLTSDGKLAAVHDWQLVDGEKSSAELKDVKIEGMYEVLFIEDVYKFMLEYPDTFLVTDTKSFLNNDVNNIKQFEQLVNTAKEMDESLLKRIVPQVYDQNCYCVMMGVYAFASVIYTLYESPDTPEEVTEFVADCDNIKVVTMMWTQLTDDFYNALTCLSKYIYFFTINVPREAEIFRMWGAHGFYTDYINPKLVITSNSKNVFINLLRKIYKIFSSSSLIQGLLLLFIFDVKLIQGLLLFLILSFLFRQATIK